MRLYVIAVGRRMPAWVRSGFSEYNRRLPREFKLELREIPAASRRTAAATEKIICEEERLIRAAIPAGSTVIALDENGIQVSSKVLAKHLAGWARRSRPVCFVIGGPDGLSDSFRHSADVLLSLSGLTLPHALARVILAEQVYRAWTILNNHPYHRE